MVGLAAVCYLTVKLASFESETGPASVTHGAVKLTARRVVIDGWQYLELRRQYKGRDLPVHREEIGMTIGTIRILSGTHFDVVVQIYRCAWWFRIDSKGGVNRLEGPFAGYSQILGVAGNSVIIQKLSHGEPYDWLVYQPRTSTWKRYANVPEADTKRRRPSWQIVGDAGNSVIARKRKGDKMSDWFVSQPRTSKWKRYRYLPESEAVNPTRAELL